MRFGNPAYSHPNRHRTFRWRTLVVIIATVPALFIVAAHAAELDPSFAAWLKAQAGIQTWSADLTQTRMLKTFTQPLTATGHVWFAAPNRFRWEIGNPASTIAVHQGDEMTVIYPRLKRAERYSLSGGQAGTWKDMLALLEAGFPHSQTEVEARFRILSQTRSNAVTHLTLQPKSSVARRMMPELNISFGTNDLALRSTEMVFADGSRMRNDFTNQVLNPKLAEEFFTPKLGGDYKIVEPLNPQKGGGR